MNEVLSSSASSSPEQGSDLSEAFGWFDVTQADRDKVEGLASIANEAIDGIIEDFYDRAGGFEGEVAQNLDQANLDSIKEEQRRHFLDLVNDAKDSRYLSERARTGLMNERSGVSPTFYLGAYSYFLNRLGMSFRDKTDADPASVFAVVMSLFKLAHCDMALTLEAFSQARQEAIEARERELSELPTPVLKLREGLLLVPVVGTLDSHRARILTMQMLEAIRDNSARAVVLDITGVPAVDSAVANHLMQAMTAARLMGAASVLTGITAEVAQSLVKIGVTGEALNPAGDLQRGIQIAERLLES